MPELIDGTFHFHSTYSHDGKNCLQEIASSLSARGLRFCIMTEHFEDFDAPTFDRYLEEINTVSGNTGFLLIPGIEVNLSGLDTIIFPVQGYEEIARLVSEGRDGQRRMFKVLAHASKYKFEAIARHLRNYKIDGVEIWNQQADGSHIPPLGLFEWVKSQSWGSQYRYFFGCDLHNVNLTVANVLSVPRLNSQNEEAIVNSLIHGDFLSRSLPTGIEYRNGSEATDFDAWLRTLRRRRYYWGELLQSARRCLKVVYKMLPRDAQHSLNDIKNFVRNKV
jgi:hypothetical protein